jgi:hypothetical protein
LVTAHLPGLRTVGWRGGGRTTGELAEALSRPIYGPFGPHPGLGGLGLAAHVPFSTIDNASRAKGGQDASALTAARPWEFHEHVGLGRARRARSAHVVALGRLP